MKPDIHPVLYDCKVSCACGNTFSTLSTIRSITLEICSACHPFFTGKQKFVDTSGRVERFQKKVATAKERAPKKVAPEVAGPPTPAPEAQTATE